LDEDLDELGIDGGEVSLALVDGERWEPFGNGGPGGARIMAWGVGVGVVERDVGSERVDELGVSHGRVGVSWPFLWPWPWKGSLKVGALSWREMKEMAWSEVKRERVREF
jgi:hypothetical protein